MAYVQTQDTQNQYSDPLDRFWNLYLLDADKEDVRMAERWKGDADGILIFTGLFATTVGSFIIATYPNLQPSSTDQSAAVLLVMTQQLGQITQLLASPDAPLLQSPLNLTALETFVVSPTAIKVNILWILSFFLSLFCALLATLVQQWSRTYIGDTQRRGTPRTRGAIHSFLRVGVERFGFNHAVDAIITLLHISVLLFTAGFLVFMLDINDLVGHTLLGAVIGASVLYLVMTVLPMAFPDCPFSTPLTLAMQILARYPSITASRIIKRRSPAYRISETRILNEWSRWYHFFKRLSLPGRQHAFSLCRTERSYQRPVHVLNQMVASLDENDEIYEFITSLSHYLRSLDLLDFDIPNQLWSQFPHQEHLTPLSNRILRSFGSTYPSHLVLAPRKVDQLVRLLLLANEAGVNRGDLNALISSEGGWTTLIPDIDVCSHLTTDYNGIWYFLVDNRNPIVSFFSHCLLSSVYAVEHYNSKALEDITLFDNFVGGIATKNYELRRDKVLSSLALCGHDFLSVYRLLFFIRVTLHYSALPASPVVAHQSIWIPVLQGLRNLTTKLDFSRISHDARIAVWRVFSVIGRDDLVPPLAQTQKYRGPSLNYSTVFEQYHILEDVLGWLARALTLRCNAERIQRRKSLPAILHMLNADGHAGSSGYERRIVDSRERRYSYPRQRKSMEHLLASDKDPDIQRRLLASRRERKSAQEVEPISTLSSIYDLPEAQEPMSTLKVGKLQRMVGWLKDPQLLFRRGSQTSDMKGKDHSVNRLPASDAVDTKIVAGGEFKSAFSGRSA